MVERHRTATVSLRYIDALSRGSCDFGIGSVVVGIRALLRATVM